jgi:hypothetical protein
MIRYIPSSAAEELSRALYALARPPTIRQEGDTEFMFGWTDDVNNQRWIEVHDDFSIVVHPDAELGPIADILQPWIDGGKLPPDTNTQLAAFIKSKRGQRLVVWDAFPQLFKDMSKTYEQMIAAGLLAEPQTL